MFLDYFLFTPPEEHYFQFSAQRKGINRRANNYNKDWKSHHQNSKNLIRTWLNSKTSQTSLNILGAGPLNDVPIEAIKCFIAPQSINSILITDANIDYLSVWRRKFSGIPFTAIVQDVTLRLESWFRELHKTNFTNYDDFLNAIKNISDNKKLRLNDFYRADLNISLNLLSQIPIHWQDAVFSLSRKKFGTALTREKGSDLLLSLNRSSAFLIELHLSQLIPRNRNKANLLLFDYKYYFPDENLVELELRCESPYDFPKPFFHFKKTSEKLVFEQDPLFNFDLRKWLKAQQGQMSWKILDSWIWKVVPHPVAKEKREFHTVICMEFSKLPQSCIND